MILRARAEFPQFGERRPLGRREVLDHFSNENRRVTLLRLTQHEADLMVEDSSRLRLPSMAGLFIGHRVSGHSAAARLKPRDRCRARRGER
jgi:hypothetical protein